MHWDGAAWTSVPGVGQGLYSVWGTSSSDVWTVGGNNGGDSPIFYWNGKKWSSTPSGTGAPLMGVWGNRRDMWTVGWFGAILHWDGHTWTPAASGTGAFLWGIWGSSPTDIWVVGDGGLILHHS